MANVRIDDAGRRPSVGVVRAMPTGASLNDSIAAREVVSDSQKHKSFIQSRICAYVQVALSRSEDKPTERDL